MTIWLPKLEDSPLKKYTQLLNKTALEYAPIGSRYHGTANENSDYDYVVEANYPMQVADEFIKIGFYRCDPDMYDSDEPTVIIRNNENINLIIVSEESGLFDLYVKCAEVGKQLKLNKKDAKILYHTIIEETVL